MNYISEIKPVYTITNNNRKLISNIDYEGTIGSNDRLRRNLKL